MVAKKNKEKILFASCYFWIENETQLLHSWSRGAGSVLLNSDPQSCKKKQRKEGDGGGEGRQIKTTYSPHNADFCILCLMELQ